jgi:two-component system phosphate regulon sensor histidine kinase PhoR
MNNYSPKRLALLNALLTSTFFCIIYIIILYSKESINYLYFIISVLVLFLFVYFVSNYLISNFLYNKIRIIYKTINTFLTKGENKIKLPDLGDDYVQQVNNEVMQWAQDKATEIENLKKMEAYRREFLGNVSHELKTPIFNIQGYILTLLDGGINDPEINLKYLQRTEHSINRLISVVEDLETISSLESGENKIKKVKFNFTELCYEVAELLEDKANKKEIKIIVGVENDRTMNVIADREKIMQVLINLVDNSIKYGKNGGKTHINFFDMDENVLIEIADNGIGITQENIPRIFERFFRVDKSRSREHGSTGLGLAIVKHILEAHGQRINVSSTPGLGTTFAFTLKKSLK